MTEPAKVEIPPMDWGLAAVNGLIATLVVLQRNGALQIADVVTQLGNTIDFRNQNFPDSRGREEALKYLYDILALTEKNEDELAAAKAKLAALSGKPAD